MIGFRWRTTATLYAQLLAFVGLGLIASQVISLLLIINLPPPTPDFYRISEIARTFQGDPPTFTERRPLQRKVVDHAPYPAMEGRMVPQIRAELAEALGVPVERVALGVAHRLPISDRRVFRLVRDRIEREGGLREELFLVSPFEVGVQRDDGRWDVVRPERLVLFTAWQQRVALWFLLSTLVMAPAAYMFARRLSAPIRLFAEAAERFGRDPNAPPLVLTGSAEIGVATAAFNGMQERLKRYVEDRTAMVGAIAHDLRTPLTRLRFRIESTPEEQRAKMAADIDQMEEMIAATLAFVRDATRPAERTRLELTSLLESLADEMTETGADVACEAEEKVVIEGDPLALRRLFTNLLENAVKFGGRARVRVFGDEGAAVVEIDDDGPGIPEADAERVFEPFYRREPSRSRQTGGIGLGLAVARTISRGHGGDVTLRNRPDGGLTVRVVLPA